MSASEHRCAAVGSRTIAANAKVRLFAKRPANGAGWKYYACLRSSGRTTKLGPRDRGDVIYVVSRFRIAGTHVAYQRTRVALGSGSLWSGHIVVRDLARKLPVRWLDPAPFRGAAYLDPDPKDGLRDLTVDAAGDVAWIVQNPTALPPPPPGDYSDTRTTEVYVARRDQAPMLLDQGDTIAATSMTRTGCAISWMHDALRRNATLC